MFRFFALNPNHNYKSLTFLSPKPQNQSVFRGSVTEYNQREGIFHPPVNRVEISGPEISPGVYDSSYRPDMTELQNLMELIRERKVSELDFDGCTLSPDAGKVIGSSLPQNHTLKKLVVCSSQLQEKGMLSILDGLRHNQSLITFHARSYNCERYYWSQKEVAALGKVISHHTSLKNIYLPNNQLREAGHIAILSKAYKKVVNREPAKISGFELNLSELPQFNIVNVLTGVLDNKSKIKFSNEMENSSRKRFGW